MSTHLLKRTGLVRLQKWGLLEDALAAGAPKITHWDYNYEDIRIVGRGAPIDGIDYELATRRLEFDRILIDAAIEAGVEFRQSYSVTDLLWRDGRVVGISGQEAGQPAEAFAYVVVGADGMQSLVATTFPLERYDVPAFWARMPPLTS